jgi:hypothetical protein
VLRFSIPEKLGVVAVSHDVRRIASDFVSCAGLPPYE